MTSPTPQTPRTPRTPRPSSLRRACYPGSFDPLTIAHLAIADAVHDHPAFAVDIVELVISKQPLGKDASKQASPQQREELVRELAATRPWLSVITTSHTLLVDIASGYDVLIVGLDKWHQINELQWYESPQARDVALASLPQLALAPRARFEIPSQLPPNAVILDLPEHLHHVSSTAVRQGEAHWRAQRD